jgi:SAM-dependent methyltransferase
MPTGRELIWHDLECGSYAADLPLWAELGDAAERALDLGCGSGRVGLCLAAAGCEVTGVERDGELASAFNARAEERELAARAIEADACDFALDRRFSLALAPMQFLQLLDADGRRRCLQRVAEHLEPKGLFAAALTEGLRPAVSGDPPPLPDATEIGEWVYSSLPLEIAAAEDGVVIRRLRQAVSPQGDLDEEVAEVRLRHVSAATVESEAEALGLRRAARRRVETTADHVGSTVVILEAA